MILGQLGQVMAFIAVTLATVIMPVAAYAVDAATVSASAAALQEAAATAALDAAQQLDTVDFRATGRIHVNSSAARSAAAAVIAAQVPAASLSALTVNGPEVAISVVEEVRLPIDFLPARFVHLQANASARLAAGYDSPSSRLLMARSNDSSGIL